MSVINIYVNDENKVNVKDDAQIIKIKGDKGDPIRFEDLTEEQKAELKGPKGNKGDTPSVPNTVHFLKEHFINVSDDNLDTALLAFFEANKDSLFTTYDNLNYQYPFECEDFNQGDINLVVHGINHFKVRVNNGKEVEIIDNVANIPVEATNDDYLNVEYIDIVGNVRELKSVEVIKEDATMGEEYDLGAGTFILKGKSAVIKTKATGNKLTFPSELTTKLSDITLRKLTIDFAVKNPNKIDAVFNFIPKTLDFVNYLNTDKFYFEMEKSVNFYTKININNTLRYEKNISGRSVYSTESLDVLIGTPV